MNRNIRKDLDILVPISLAAEWKTKRQAVSDIEELHQKYGLSRFLLSCPEGGWRSAGYPPTSYFEERAELIREIKEELEPKGIICGWWNMLTVKSGRTEGFTPMTKEDGSLTPFATCPLDPTFRERLSSDIALVARIAKPAFIMLEDDFSIQAAAGPQGCFCQRHLEEFARRTGEYRTREQLLHIFRQKTEESYALLRQWRELMKDSLSGLAGAIRAAVDTDSPEIPIGYMQAGAADAEGDCTLAVSKALAGPRHTPFSRIFGTFYFGVNAKEIPAVLYHPLYSRQHIGGEFHFLYEEDTYPRNRFYTSGAHVRAMMGIVTSFGYEGAVYHVEQRLDHANEEEAYARVYAEERKRWAEVASISAQCRVKGVNLPYDPFWNNQNGGGLPEWLSCVSRFGIPYTSVDSEVSFWDATCARHATDDEILAQLSRGTILDGNAAKILCERGFSAYLGAEIGEDVAPGYQVYDLNECEIIRPAFVPDGQGRAMASAHLYAAANGKLLEVRPIHPACEVISEGYSFDMKPLGSAMTRFQNALGGRVVIMGLTVRNNPSQSLFNYRRQRLLQDMVTWCADGFAYVREAPDVFVVMNEAVDPEKSGLIGMLTLVNLCEDPSSEIILHLPPDWRNATDFCILNKQGRWQSCKYEMVGDSLILKKRLDYLSPLYILVKRRDD